jgi:hypothetical protein
MVIALTDLLGGCPATVDKGTMGELGCGDRAWGQYHVDSDWHVVLQDDAIPCDNFTTHVESALGFLSDAGWDKSVVSFYTGTLRPQRERVASSVATADAVGATWLKSRSLMWGVGVAMPTFKIRQFLSWGKRHSGLPYDVRIGTFARRNEMPVLYTVPSLVDHADGPSLVKHSYGPPTGPRRAHNFRQDGPTKPWGKNWVGV